MVAEYYKTKIAEALVELVNTTKFKQVQHLEDGSIKVIEDEVIKPASVKTNEISGFFGESHHRGVYQREKTTWNWQLIIYFPVQVLLEEFERAFCENPPFIDADPDNKTRAVRLKFESADYTHPPEYDSPTGTRVTYSFDADIMPA